MVMEVSAPAQIIGKRYLLLDKVGVGGMGVVYRATDRLTGATIALKQVSRPEDQVILGSHTDASNNFRLALAHEFKTLASLRHPNIISVLDYGFDSERQPYFTMDYLAQALPIFEAGRSRPFESQVNLLIQVLQALSYLHRRGILHRDLKPANILVTGSQVKVLDFGLSSARGATSSTSGTFAYMAPEVLKGEAATEASDLYAVGVIAYELFAGRHPFDVDNISTLINDTMYKQPDIAALPINSQVAGVLERLLAKQPADRYANAGEIIDAYNAALGQRAVYETAAMRESFLQAAHFVGREAEFAQLSGALDAALTGGGSGWLVGGESGVGKSRLIEELRTLALVNGALVLRGQAVSEGARRFQVWREALRWLALLAELSDSEASALKPLVPDIAVLLRRPVADPPEIDAQAAQLRLFATVGDVLARQSGTLMILLEDLHWASSEDLSLLEWVTRAVAGRPILLVGTYRIEESPDLPKRFPALNALELRRLSSEAIGNLSASMLGEPGRHADVVELLQRETEGNVFFLVEVVRALAEEVGTLDKIGTITLPKHVFTGGIQRIVERRLNRVPEDARETLQAAAVIGRELDLRLLAAVSPKVKQEAWLEVCSNAAVLDVQDGRWRFIHDKLREGLLGGLTPDQRRDLNHRVASAIEASYPDASDRYVSLAFHWAGAGDSQKEGRYAALVGQQALGNGAYMDAKKYLERALELADPVDTEIQERLERQIGGACMGLGLVPEAGGHLVRVLTLAKQRVTDNSRQRLLYFFMELARQIVHRFLGVRHVPDSDVPRLLELVRAFEQMANVYYWDNQKVASFYMGLAALNNAEKAPPSRELVRMFGSQSVGWGWLGWHRLARYYARKSLETADKLDDEGARLGALRLILAYAVGAPDWDMVARETPRALEIGYRVRDYRATGDCIAHQRHTLWYQSKFAESAKLTDELAKVAKLANNIQMDIWVNCYKADDALLHDQIDHARRYLETATQLYESHTAQVQRLHYQAVYARLYLRTHEDENALAMVDLMLTQFARSSPSIYTGIYSYSAAPEVLLMLAESRAEATPQQRAAWLEKAAQACHFMGDFTKTFAIGEPRQWLWQGLYNWLTNKPDAAIKNWGKCIEVAKKIEMPHDEGLGHLEWGRHLPAGEPARAEHLKAALHIFEAVGATYDAKRTRVLLGAAAGA